MSLSKEKVLVVGLGEVGSPLFHVLKECGKFRVYGFDVDRTKMSTLVRENLPEKVDIMHVCIPGNHIRFVSIVADYIKRFNPDLVIVNSTVPPRTTQRIHEQCSCKVAHSPIRGVHKSPNHMVWELKRWIKYVGGVDAESAKSTSKHFEIAGLKVKVLRSSLETELAKLFETTYRAWMIACFQEMHRISRVHDASFDDVVDFLEDTHRIRLDRPIHYPAVIGGHCLIPNIELLAKRVDSQFLALILRSNEKRKKEIQEVDVRKEVGKIRKRVEALEKKLSSNVI
jgi:UDP-N-acetyl-D-mannosaminuronate dehydrogenase